MSSFIQLKSFMLSFIYGFLIYLVLRFNKFIIYDLTKIIKYIITSICLVDLSLIYIYLIYKINYGYYHVYFILVLIIGFMINYYLYNYFVKLCKKIFKKCKYLK